MGSVFRALSHFAPARIVFGAIVASLAGIAMLLCFVVVRRWLRGRYFARRDALAAYIRSHWQSFLREQSIPPQFAVAGQARDVLEAILLDRIVVAKEDDLAPLVDCLRRCGALDMRIAEARSEESWKRRAALVILGRTRAPESVPALAEALDSADVETKIAAVRGLGKIADASGAVPILERYAARKLDVPWGVLKNALLSCCENDPELLSRYLRVAEGSRRELLARVLAEVADSAQVDELVVMASDESTEIRAAAARGLGRADANIALPPLAQLASDTEWVVRLRAVVALGSFLEHGAVPLLVRVLTDRNRLVRQRAAWALIRSPRQLREVLKQVIAAGDEYGIQAVVAELDRCGMYAPVVEQLRRGGFEMERLVEPLERARARLAPEGQGKVERASTKKSIEVFVA